MIFLMPDAEASSLVRRDLVSGMSVVFLLSPKYVFREQWFIRGNYY